MPLTELATLGLESWCDFVLREVFNLLWHLWLCCLIVAQNLLCTLSRVLALVSPSTFIAISLVIFGTGCLRWKVWSMYLCHLSFFLLYLSPSPFTFLALPPLIDIVPGEPTLGLPVISWFCTTRHNMASLQLGIFKSVANSWFWSPPWWSLHQLDHFLELLGADVDLLLWSKGQHVLWLNAKGRLALWASVFEMSTST